MWIKINIMAIKDSLQQLGLNEKETAVYLSCLELGESSIVAIRAHTNLARTTVFHALERLEQKGLVEIIETPHRRIYFPHPPKKIVSLLIDQAEKIKLQAESFREHLPELNQLYNVSPFQPKVRLFLGEEIKQIYEEILASPVDEFMYLGETNKILSILSKRYLSEFVKKKVEKGIWTKSLRVKPEEDPFFDPKQGLRRVRYLPESFKAPANIYIYHHNVAIITTSKENFALVVTSKENAETMRSWYNELWKISK